MKSYKSSEAVLFLVPTPIGNLGDITIRAVDVLRSADRIFCEDTRRAKVLLKSLHISRPLVSLHSYNESRRVKTVMDLLERGEKIAYICDSGTPGISDPGASLVRSARERGFAATVLPGPSALTTAVVMSGLPCDRFIFLGFMPSTPKNRRRSLRTIVDFPFTIAFYEAPHRIRKTLSDCEEILGDRRCSVIREISKIHEEVLCGTISEISHHFSQVEPRGEMVVVIEGKR